jgi:hypothetical protein
MVCPILISVSLAPGSYCLSAAQEAAVERMPKVAATAMQQRIEFLPVASLFAATSAGDNGLGCRDCRLQVSVGLLAKLTTARLNICIFRITKGRVFSQT